MLLWPPLHAEDGTEMLAYYYCHREPSSILRAYNGYVSLLPNLIGYSSLGAPIALAPRLLAAAPFALTVACLMLPFSVRLFGRDVSPGARAAPTLLLAALPLGTANLVANTTYSLWNCLLALALLSLAPPAAGWLGTLGRLALAIPLLASHPLSLVVLPVFAATARRDRPGAAAALALILLGLTYQLAGVARPELDSRIGAVDLGLLAVRYLAERVVFTSLFGGELRVALHESGLGPAVTVIGLLVIAAVSALCFREWRRGGVRRWQQAGLAYLVGAFTLVTVSTRVTQGRWLGSFFGERYFYVPKVLFLLLLISLGLAAWSRSSPRRRRLIGAAVCAYAALLGYVERDRYAVDVAAGRRIAAFVDQAATLESRNAGRRGIDTVLVRERGEPIRLLAPPENVPCEEAASPQ